MNNHNIRQIGTKLRDVANRYAPLAETAWTLFDQLMEEMRTADPKSDEAKELELMVIGLVRCIPRPEHTIQIYNHANALSWFPMSAAPCRANQIGTSHGSTRGVA